MLLSLKPSREALFKGFYFLLFVSFTTHNFLNPHLDRMGFTGIQIGSFKAASALVMIFAQPIWGLFCDMFRLRTRVLSILLLISGITFFTVAFTTHYSLILAIIIIYSFFKSPIVPISDSIVLNYVGGSQREYTRIRLWGAIGLTASVVLMGTVLERTFSQYLFHGYLLFSLLALAISFLLPGWREETRGRLKLSSLLQNSGIGQFALFLLGVLFLQTAYFIFDGFFGIYMSQNFGSDIFLGLALTVGGLSEIFIYTRLIELRKSLKPRTMLMTSALVSGVRWLLYPLANGLVHVLMIQLFHGFTFGFFYIASVTYTNRILSRELSTTGQTLLWALGFGVTTILGSMLGGFLLDYFGLSSLFHVASGLSFFSSLIFLVAMRP